MAETIKIGGELESMATGGIVAAASAIKDKIKNKTQGQINAETDATLAEHTSTINGLNSQNYVTVTATGQTAAVTDVLPATGEVATVYRVGNWDGSQYDETCYSEYSWNGSAYVHLSTKTQIGEVFDISAYHATGGTLATYADLSAALDSNGGGVPQSLQKGGMSIKFVQSSDNKYVQFRLRTQNFSTTESDWQGVDEEPTAGSHNFVESGGVHEDILLKVGTVDFVDIPIRWRGNGTAINTSGNVSSYATYGIRTYPIKVKAGDIIYVYGKIPYANLSKIAITDINETFYTPVVNYTATNTDETTYWECQEDCYVVVTSAAIVARAIIKKKYNGLVKLVEELLQFKTDLNVEHVNTYIQDISDATDGYYDVSGNKAGNNIWTSKMFEVQDVIQVIYSGDVQFLATAGLRFFSEAMVNLGNALVGGDTKTTYINEVVEIPNETKYIAVTFMAASDKAVTFRKKEIYNIESADLELQNQINNALRDQYNYSCYPTDHNHYVDATGNLVQHNSYWTTGWIEVEGLTNVIYNGYTKWGVQYGVLMKDSNNDIYKYLNGDSTVHVYTNEIVAAPNANIVAVAFNFLNAGPTEYRYGKVIGTRLMPINEKANYKQHTSQSWLLVGDSLTHVNIATSKRYYEYINERLGFIIANKASGGVGYARMGTDNNNFVHQVNSATEENVGLITIFGSGNDKGANLPLGTATDVGSSTIAGYINNTISAVQEKYPLVPFGIITPTPWKDGEPSDTGDYAKWFKDYSALIVDICYRRGVPCLDLYHCSNLHPSSTEFRALAYKKDGVWKKVTDTSVIDPSWVLITEDNIAQYQALSDDTLAVGDYVSNSGGIHPDEEGHKIIAPRIGAFIGTLLL